MNLEEFKSAHRKKDMSTSVLRSLLANLYEGEFHDFKAQLDLGDPVSVAGLAKDVAAFHNHMGGYIIFGVEDRTFRKIGFPNACGLDTKLISDQLAGYLGDSVEVIYSHHELEGLRYGLLFVSGKDSVPVLMLRDGPLRNGKHVFRKNDVCLREADQTKIISDHKAIKELFSASPTSSTVLRDTYGTEYHFEPLKKLIKPDYKVFIGRESHKRRLMDALGFEERAWIISINGIGGVGKTALATWASWECHDRNMYEVIISVSAKQRELTLTGIRPVVPTLVSYENLLNEIAEVIGYPFDQNMPIEQKEREVTELLSLAPTLLVIDNYETIDDDRIGDFLRSLKGQTKALVTTRRRLGKGEYAITLEEMDDQESVRYVFHLASQLSADEIFRSNEEDIRKLIDLSGKLPLAMKWLVGRVKLCGDISSALREFNDLSPRTSDILEFCFRGIFKVLSPHAQNLLCIMPIFQKGPTYLELKMGSGLSDTELDAALEQIKDISLVDENPADERDGYRYTALPLTLKFAQNELSRREGLERATRKRLADYYSLESANSAAQRQYQALYEGRAGTQKERTALFLTQMGSNAYHREGNYDEAVGLFKRALDVLPTSHDALLAWALTERQEGNYAKAAELFEAATKTPRGKGNPRVWYFWGSMLKDLRHWKEAAQKLEQAANLEPTNGKLLHQVGFCYSLAGHFKLADEYYDRILSLDPPVPLEQQVYTYTAKAQNFQKWGRLVESLLAWEDVLKLKPNDAQALQGKQDIEKIIREGPRRRTRGRRMA